MTSFVGNSPAGAVAAADDAPEAASALLGAGLEQPHSTAVAVSADRSESRVKERLFMIEAFDEGWKKTADTKEQTQNKLWLDSSIAYSHLP